MLNLMSYLGMSLQSELCLWNMFGLVVTIFDATLFKVNANLKQVWAMDMPSELTMPVQRSLRTMISGIMLVQCFTVYIYLASYIVMLYPIYLEERPSLLLPWLLLAAVKKLLCELMSLTLGLGTCVLVGPTRSACIKFVVSKIMTLLPSFYMWLLVFSYYTTLKLPNSYLKFPVARPSSSDPDYGLELAVRRRRTKSLLDEHQLRTRLLQTIRGSQSVAKDKSDLNYRTKRLYTAGPMLSDISVNGARNETDIARPFSIASNVEWMEDWFGSEIAMPRDTDRVVNQFSLMLLRIAAFINSGESDTRKFLQSQNPKPFYDDDTIIKRASYRKSEAPIVKSNEAVVPIKCDSHFNLCFSMASDKIQDIDEIVKSSEEVVTNDTKENLFRWNRKRKAKSFKLNQRLQRKRSKHCAKVKVSQSIIDLIDRCKKEVDEKLKVKKEINYMSFVDAESNKISTDSNIPVGPVVPDQSTYMRTENHKYEPSKSTNYPKSKGKDEIKKNIRTEKGVSTHDKVVINQSTYMATENQTYKQSTSTYNPRVEGTEQIIPKHKIDVGVSTHDKGVSELPKEYDSISSIQALSLNNADVDNNIDEKSTWSEEIMSDENKEENIFTASDKKLHILRNAEDVFSKSSINLEVRNSIEDQNLRYSDSVESRSNTLASEDQANEESIESKISKEYTGSNDIASENVEMQESGIINQQENSDVSN